MTDRLRDTNIIDRSKQEVDLNDLRWNREGSFWYTDEHHEFSPEEILEYAARLEQRVIRLERVADEYRGAGYHPSGLKRCQHGMSRWIGTHCKYDSRALKALAESKRD